MFQLAAVVVKAVLVQFPVCCGEANKTRAGPAAAGVVVPEVAAVVVVTAPGVVVVVAVPLGLDPAAPGVVVVVDALDPDGGGNVYARDVDAWELPTVW